MENKKLEEYEEVCSECKGTGLAREKKDNEFMIPTCRYCDGTGKTDWLQKITKKPIINDSGSHFTYFVTLPKPIEKIEIRFNIDKWKVEYKHGK